MCACRVCICVFKGMLDCVWGRSTCLLLPWNWGITWSQVSHCADAVRAVCVYMCVCVCVCLRLWWSVGISCSQFSRGGDGVGVVCVLLCVCVCVGVHETEL